MNEQTTIKLESLFIYNNPLSNFKQTEKENHSKLEKIKPIKGINIKWIYANAKMKLRP